MEKEKLHKIVNGKYIHMMVDSTMKEQFLKNGFEIITKDNIHLYYEFMNDEDIYKESINIDSVISPRAIQLNKLFKGLLNITQTKYKKGNDIFANCYTSLRVFEVKDTLKPIDDYIEEIKASNEYKEYIKNNQ